MLKLKNQNRLLYIYKAYIVALMDVECDDKDIEIIALLSSYQKFLIHLSALRFEIHGESQRRFKIVAVYDPSEQKN